MVHRFDKYAERLCDSLRHRLAQRTPHQTDYEVFNYFANETGLLLDIGANFGLSVVSFRIYNKVMRILSFEPLPWMEPPLRLLKEKEGELFDYCMTAVSDHDGDLTIEIPMVEDVPNFFRASGRLGKFESPECRRNLRKSLKRDGRITTEELVVPSVRLDSLDLSPDIIKIDVEGLELSVLRGAWKTICRCRPVIFLEPSADKAEILETLRPLDYLGFYYIDGRLKEYILSSDTDNALFLPREKHQELQNRSDPPGA